MEKVRRKLFFIMGILVLISLLIIIGYNMYNVRISEEMHSQEYQANLQVYVQFMEDSMKDIENTLYVNSQQDENLKTIIKSETSIDRYLALMKKKQEFQKEIRKNHFLDGMFLYDGVHETYVDAVGESVSDAMKNTLKQNKKIVVDDFENRKTKNKWMAVMLDGEYYLLRMMKTKNLYIGAWVKPEHILAKTETRGAEEDPFLICEKNGNVLTRANDLNQIDLEKEYVFLEEKKYKVYHYTASQRDISLVMLTGDNSGRILFFYCVIPSLLIIAMGIMITSIVWKIIGKIVFYPIEHMMLVKTLEKNEVDLKFLQIQMNPHFLNNCLNLIRSLIVLEQYEEAETAVLELADYTRASFGSDTLVTVENEYKHIQSWYGLQKLRMKHKISLCTEIHKGMWEQKIPTMLIQTFVENAAKHYGKSEEAIVIEIHASYGDAGKNKEYMEITIRDNGIGFPREILEKLQDGKELIDKRGMKHIGIANIKARLRILYGDEAKIELSNKEQGGAQIRIVIPVKEEGGAE